MRKPSTAVACAALLLLGLTGQAFAANVPPNNIQARTNAALLPQTAHTCTDLQDFLLSSCQLSWYGIRFYGTFDGGAGYQTHSARFDPYASSGANTYLGKSNLNGRFVPQPNTLSLSNLGLEVKEPLAPQWSFVARLEMQYDPYSLKILDGPKSVYKNIGVPLAYQTSAGDSNSQGTIYDGQGFAGISNEVYGALTFGRQGTLMADAFLVYDPETRASVSPLGFFGSYAGGGDTEDSRTNTSIKYRGHIENYRFAVFGQIGGYSAGNASKGAIQGDIGVDYNIGAGALSIDALGGFTRDGVTAGLSGPTDVNGYPVNPFTSTNQVMTALLSNNTSAMVAAKYSIDRLKLYAGYQFIEFANPSDPFTVAGSGFTNISGEFLCFACNARNGTNIVSTAYTHHKLQNLVWFGAKYAITPTLDATGAFYHIEQNDYSGGARNGFGGTCGTSGTALSSCAGALNSVSGILDWRFLPKWDIYYTSVYERLSGGLNNGYLSNDNWSNIAGLRFTF